MFQSRMVGVESGRAQVLLEACIENATKATLFLEYTRFDAGPGLSAVRVAPALQQPDSQHRSQPAAAVAAYVAGLQVRERADSSPAQRVPVLGCIASKGMEDHQQSRCSALPSRFKLWCTVHLARLADRQSPTSPICTPCCHRKSSCSIKNDSDAALLTAAAGPRGGSQCGVPRATAAAG